MLDAVASRVPRCAQWMGGGLETKPNMRRKGLVLLAVTAAAAIVGVGAAWAGFPNILRWGEPTLVDGSNLTLARTASAESTGSGLVDPRVLIEDVVVVGVKEGIETTLIAPYEAVYVCVNGGGNVPSAANKTTLVGELETSAVFPASKNGKAVGSLLTGPLPSAADAAAENGFACPSGQVLEFDRVVFSGLVIAAQGGESVVLDVTLISNSVHGLT